MAANERTDSVIDSPLPVPRPEELLLRLSRLDKEIRVTRKMLRISREVYPIGGAEFATAGSRERR
jgi:hypothetical protein